MCVCVPSSTDGPYGLWVAAALALRLICLAMVLMLAPAGAKLGGGRLRSTSSRILTVAAHLLSRETHPSARWQRVWSAWCSREERDRTPARMCVCVCVSFAGFPSELFESYTQWKESLGSVCVCATFALVLRLQLSGFQVFYVRECCARSPSVGCCVSTATLNTPTAFSTKSCLLRTIVNGVGRRLNVSLT